MSSKANSISWDSPFKHRNDRICLHIFCPMKISVEERERWKLISSPAFQWIFRPWRRVPPALREIRSDCLSLPRSVLRYTRKIQRHQRLHLKSALYHRLTWRRGRWNWRVRQKAGSDQITDSGDRWVRPRPAPRTRPRWCRCRWCSLKQRRHLKTASYL